jgi:acyl-CoA synthetase (AMP-forming)/AMP-acid ligase II
VQVPTIAEVEAGLSSQVRVHRQQLRERWAQLGSYRRATLAEIIEQGAQAYPGTVLTFARRDGTEQVRLADVRRRAEHAAAGLSRLGLQPGDAIAIQLPNRPEAAVAYAAAGLLGLVVVPIVHSYGPSEVEFIIRDSGASALILPDRWGSIDFADRAAAAARSPSMRWIIAAGEDLAAATTTWRDLEQVGARHDRPSVSAAPGDVCLLVYTSGTTADPKGVLHTHDSLVAELAETPTPPGGRSGTPTLQPFPAGHTAGIVSLLGPWLHGGATILMDTWRAETAARLIADNQVVSMAGTPYYISTLLEVAAAEPDALASLRDVMTGGAGVPPEIVREGDCQGWQVVRCYGSTEQPSTTACAAGDALELRASCDGKPIGMSQVRIVDGQFRPVPPGQEGEVTSIGPEQFAGYTDPEQSRRAFTPDGWFRTGDIGVLDSAGYLTITDRMKDVVIRGGENISSKQVEDIMLTLGSVADVAVIGMPDPLYGERVFAFVVLRPGASLSLEEIRAHFAAAGVARHKTPEGVQVVAELPRTAAGKVRKHVLRERLGRQLP